MIGLNIQLVNDTKKQLKKINMLYIFAFILGGLLLTPFINIFLGMILCMSIYCGLLIAIYIEVKKHYKDRLLLTALWIALSGLVFNVIQIKMKVISSGGEPNENQIILILGLFGLIPYACVLSSCILLAISRARYAKEIETFNRMQLNPTLMPYTGKITPTKCNDNGIYEQRDTTTKSFISFVIRAIVAIAIYFLLMDVPIVKNIIITPFLFIMNVLRPMLSQSSEQFSLLIEAWFNVYIQLIFAILFILLFRKEIRVAIKKITWATTSLTLIGYGISRLVNFIVIMFLKLLNITIPQSANQAGLEEMQSIAPFAIIIAAVLLAPITEELVFRQGLAEGLYRILTKIISSKQKLMKDIAMVIAILASGFLFGFIHVMSHHDYIAMIPYVVSGLVYTAFYFYSGRNITVTIFIHMLNNLIATIITL